jgi:hypothetical protein
MNVLFHHYPLCGGRGVMTWLQNQIPAVYWQKLKPRGSLEDARVIGGHEVSEEHVNLAGWTDYYPFTILRDPEERMVSLHAWKARKVRRGPSERHARDLLPFEDWIRLPPANPMLLFLQTCVPKTHIYRLDEIPRVLMDLGKALRIPRSGYRAIGVSGAGSKATDEQRALVRRFHELDCEFWADLRISKENLRTS